MTNIRSIAGGALWATVAALMMMSALEPVALRSGAAPVEVAQAATATTTASL